MLNIRELDVNTRTEIAGDTAGAKERAAAAVAPVRGGFSLIELLTVISIIGLLAGIGVGVAGVASRKMRENRVKAELQMLVTAIERYHAEHGQYPPDNAKNGVNFNPAVNQLYYELMGTISTNQGASYRLPNDNPWLSTATLVSLFNAPGLLNSAAASVSDPNPQPKRFLKDLKTAQHKLVRLPGLEPTPVEILVAPVDWPDKAPFSQTPPLDPKRTSTDASARTLWRVNPWRYVSTHPTNNPNSFDLWAEVVVGKQVRVFGNWKE